MVEHSPAVAPLARRQFVVRFLIASAVIALRNPDWWIHPQFLAEDGQIFFTQQTLSGLGALFAPYNGYLHLVPRLFAWLASPFPVLWQPLLYQAFGVALAAACAAFFAMPECRFVIASDRMRMAVSLLALADCNADEVFATLLSCQVFLVPLALLLLACDRDGWLRRVVVGLSVLTAPGLILFLPWAIWKWLRDKSMLAAVFAVGAAIQTSVVLTHPAAGLRPSPPLWLPFAATVASWIYRVWATLFAGLPWAMFAGVRGGITLALVLFAGMMATVVAVSRKFPPGSGARRVFLLSLSLGPVLLLEVFVVRRELLSEFVHLDRFTLGGGARYFLMPGWLLLVAAALAMDQLAARVSPGRRALLLVLLFVPGVYENYRIRPYENLEWPTEAAKIERWKRDRTGPVQVPINPTRPNPWWISLP